VHKELNSLRLCHFRLEHGQAEGYHEANHKNVELQLANPQSFVELEVNALLDILLFVDILTILLVLHLEETSELEFTHSFSFEVLDSKVAVKGVMSSDDLLDLWH
jgi:hypothetical protein